MTSGSQLLVIRHAVAESRETFAETGQDDALRPLTARGRRKMERVAQGIHSLVPAIGLLAASPLVRAQQTAEIVGALYERAERSTSASLEPERSPASFGTWLRKQPQDVVAVVGHEPALGILVTWLMTGSAESRVRLRKGGACLLSFSGRRSAGTATLEWLLTPAQLLRLAR